MARNKVMKVWTAIVTAFIALCTALGLVTTTAAAAVAQTEQKSNSNGASIPQQRTAAPATFPWSSPRALPPTMKQRIRAEAHGKTPRCRHRSPADTASSPGTDCTDEDPDADADHLTPLKR
ncbi:hypothetical protein SAMN06272771_4001 [Streptomyces sp. Ag82_O1-12]|uniref:DUF6344 domain-containing protein n=1 Tax=unclassified Streptomyces TaxID=2593676 RepID=UPI000BD001AD|nr:MULTISPECIES: DUF6344 domain-containing protein [unclassified Streptomyces]SMQ17578.1 hypothetical protein SAMN06272771_4001 [Streptomyces sp. Ag82_O1-12]SOD46614.1 hypothetical protein SAMN06272727_4000 [Streptomyces sp. Ag82_G6-1]